MKVIVGLGNPGEKYEKARHNLGFMALDTLLSKLESVEKTFWDKKKDLKAEIKQIKYKDIILLLVKPATFMNNSGEAVTKVLNYYKIAPTELYVIHDDLDLPFGKIRVRFGGAAGGHHGVESIIEALKTDKFLRVRLGIGSNERAASGDKHDIDDYVLGNISSAERGKVKTMMSETTKIIENILKHGIDLYMSKYNK